MTFKFGMGIALAALSPWIALAQVTSVGSGSYTTALPAGTAGPEVSAPYATATGPVATHKFWTSKYWTSLSGGNNMYPEPLQANAGANGMQIGAFDDRYGWDPVLNTSDKSANTSAFYQGFAPDMTIGNATVNASAVNIGATSDWSADFTWGPSLTIRMGRGMPFAYVLTDGTPVTLAFLNSPVILSGTIGTSSTLAVSVTSTSYGLNYTNYYGLFCPAGGVWSQSGKTLTCATPAGSNYMSVGLLPGLSGTSSANDNINTTTIAQQMVDFSKVAFSFPANTQVSWAYNQSSSTVATTYTVTTQSMDGVSTGFLMALYPHQYDALAGGVNTTYTYLNTFGNLEVNSGTSFTTTDTFHGILPFMPPTTNYNLATLKAYVDEAPLATLVGDDYDQGKLLGQVAQDLPLAQLSDASAYTSLDSSLTGILQDWFTAAGKSTDLFYYDNRWNSLIGYPAGYFADTQLDDHHFHYGYFIHASAIQGLFDPSWIASAQWGGMATLLQQDIANYDRANTMSPFLRHFDVYAGHSWASGTAPFSDGGNEESSSEAVNAWTGMILLGEATGNTQLRDAAIWLYTQETKGVAYYWFNEQPAWVNAHATSTFPSWFTKLSIANVFDDKGDTATWFGAQPDYEHAIEFLPFTGGSLHLGLDPAYVQANYLQDHTENTAQAMSIANQWPDYMEMNEAFSDPQTALTQWQSNPSGSFPQQGESLAHEYAWLMSLNALGQVDATVTANTPLYAVFNNHGTVAHVAFNASSAPITVTFSDSATVSVPASSMASDSALVTPITLSNGTTTTQAPAAPTGLTANAISSNEIDLSWTYAANVTYSVYRGAASGFTPSPSNLIASGLTAASYSDTTLTASTEYFYAVEAVNSAGSSAASTQANATTNATGTTIPESNTLYLTGGATAAVASTLSFTGPAAGADSMPANNPQSPGVVDNPLVYRITGINGTYNIEAVTQFDLYVNPGANAGEAAQVQVIYDIKGDGTDVRTEQYSYYATAPTNTWQDYNQTSQGGIESGNTTGTFGNLTNGTVTIKVWDALPGPNSAPISLSVGSTSGAVSDLVIPFTGVTQTASTSAPSAPTGVQASGASSSAVSLSWTASVTAGVTYSVYRSTSSGFTPGSSNLVASSLSTVSYTDTGLTASTAYYYVVAAVNSAGTSDSTQVSATTLASGGGTPESNTLYLTGGAAAAVASTLSFTEPTAGADSIPANNPQSPDVVDNPLVYRITGINGTYNSAAATQFDLYIDAGANAGEAAQAQVIYDMKGDGTDVRTEQYSYFATDPVVGWEDYAWNSRGGIESGNTTGNFGNMTNGTVTLKVWDALPGANSAPISLSVGSTSGAVSDLVIPFTGITQAQLPADPTNVQASAASASEVDLTWTASATSGVTYNVYRGTTSGFTPGASTLLGNVSTDSYNDTSVGASTTYYYVVAAVSSSGSAAAAQVSATTPALITPAVTVTPASSTITTADPLALTVTVSGGGANPAPAGSVTLTSGSYTSTAAALSGGIAQITIPAGSLAISTDTVTATYTPDVASASIYNSATGTASATVSAAPIPGIALTNSGNITISPGATSGDTSTIAITPSGGFTGAVNLSCVVTTNLSNPTDAVTCALGSGGTASTSVTVSGTAPVTATLTALSTAESSKANSPLKGFFAGGGAALAALLLFGIPARRRSWRIVLGVVLLAAILGATVGCGGSGKSSGGTTAGAYSATVTGTDAATGKIASSTTVTVTVN